MGKRGGKNRLVVLMTAVRIILLGFTRMALAQNIGGEADIPKMVSHCVSIVHKAHPSAALIGMYGPAIASFYQNFDAFYNPASGLVQSNATTMGSQPSLFLFRKCMAESGFPLN